MTSVVRNETSCIAPRNHTIQNNDLAIRSSIFEA